MNTGSEDNERLSNNRSSVENLLDLSHQVLRQVGEGGRKRVILRRVAESLLRFFQCPALEIWLEEGGGCFHGCAELSNTGSFRFHLTRPKPEHRQSPASPDNAAGVFLRLRNEWQDAGDPLLTEGSSILVDSGRPLGSAALIPLAIGDEVVGILQLRDSDPGRFTAGSIAPLEQLARILAVALVNQRSRAALRERVKELGCLYAIARIAGQPGISLGDILEGIVELLPPAWQYPEIASGRIVLDEQSYVTDGFVDRGARQTAQILVNGEPRGMVEVVYGEERSELDEGPFLAEERNLIDAVAGQIAMIIEHKLAGEERENLQEQLRHADRLATIGQLAAGVAHELNEPLANILGFAQLAAKCAGLPEDASGDLEKIIRASLHAREVVKKLMLFARQTPPKKAEADLNRLVEEGLYFVESRCTRAGVELARELADGLPALAVDKAQLHQVLVNLVVNAVQAMPDGGRLVIRTTADSSGIALTVEDTGGGMSEETMKKMFIPFYTTKDVNEGTGLGLAVVHGIVTSHGGAIDVASELNRGTKIEIRFPLDRRGDGEEGVPFDEIG